jgi:tetratricopeptide (TPR) repeat protein
MLSSGLRKLNRIPLQQVLKRLKSHDPTRIMTDVDIEKELFVIKRRMGGFHSKGHYKAALECAEELEQKVLQFMGKENAIYASCLNNTALMHKQLGNIDQSIEIYTKALHIYEDTVGKSHSSYAVTLGNLGAGYKACAEISKGMEKTMLLERAKEALTDSFALLEKLHG